MKRLLLSLLSACLALTGLAHDQELDQFIPKQDQASVVKHDRIDLVFDSKTLTPIWVSHRLDPEEAVRHTADRKGLVFHIDPQVKGSPSPDNYAKHHPWVLGHVAPADDFDFDIELMRQTFYTSNVVPQNDKNNISAWKILEMRIRKVCASGRALVVICGPEYDGEPLTIGHDAVGVPDHLWKLVISIRTKEAVAFLYANDDSDQPLLKARLPVVKLQQRIKRTFIDETYKDGGSLLEDLER